MDQLSLFNKPMPTNGDRSNQLNVVYARFERNEPFELSLFDGFQSMKVLTYSASIGMTIKMLERFEWVECIFGFEGVIGDIGDLIGFQKVASDEILLTTKALEDKRKQRIVEAIHSNRIRFYVVKDSISHSKIYLLEGDGKRRVIVGSANFSDRAFSGKQAETLLVFDDDELAWNFYTEEYEAVKGKSTTQLNLPDMEVTEVRIEKVPILERADASETGIEVFINTDVSVVTVPMIIRRVERISEGVRRIATPVMKAQKGKIFVNRKAVGQLVTLLKSQKHDEETQAPIWLSIYSDSGKVFLSGQEISLTPDRAQVRSDVQAMVDYFGNYENGFHGDVLQHQKDYFAFMSWFYLSPFICDLRNRAVVEQKYIFDIPSFAVIYGKSNCGKTRLIETLMRSMFGFFQFVDKQQFTRTNMRALLHTKRRFPVVFDDIDKKQFSSHAPDVIKDETFILEEYPSFVLSMNAEDHSFPSELVKRCLMFYTQASLPDNDAAAKPLFNSISAIRNRLTTSLYQEYLGQAIRRIQTDGLPDDILLFSSEILTTIFQDSLSQSLPPWCRLTTIGEYKDKRYGKIRAELLKMYQTNKESWVIQGDEVIITVLPFEAPGLRKDIPDWLLKAGSKGGTIVLDRKPLEEFLGTSFKKSLLERLFRQ